MLTLLERLSFCKVVSWNYLLLGSSFCREKNLILAWKGPHFAQPPTLNLLFLNCERLELTLGTVTWSHYDFMHLLWLHGHFPAILLGCFSWLLQGEGSGSCCSSCLPCVATWSHLARVLLGGFSWLPRGKGKAQRSACTRWWPLGWHEAGRLKGLSEAVPVQNGGPWVAHGCGKVTKSTERGARLSFCREWWPCRWKGLPEAVPVQNGGPWVAHGWQVGLAALPVYLVWLHGRILPVFCWGLLVAGAGRQEAQSSAWKYLTTVPRAVAVDRRHSKARMWTFVHK